MVGTMALLEDIYEDIDKVLGKPMDITEQRGSSTVVPKSEKLGYSQGKIVDATYLYTDMLDSSGLAVISDKEAAAKVFRSFLNVSTRIIRSNDGHIRSFDGDRVMGIFTGPNKEDRAVKSAMIIKWAVDKLITPELHRALPVLSVTGWRLRQVSGIATGTALLARAGFRDNDDMISIGAAPNLAAKLSDCRSDDRNYATYIGKGTYDNLSDDYKYSEGKNMWAGAYHLNVGGKRYPYYRSSYHWFLK